MEIPVVTHHHADVAGVRVFYRQPGPAEAPGMLLLHGFPSSSAQYRRLIDALGTRYRIIAPDYPGFGQTEAPPVDELVDSDVAISPVHAKAHILTGEPFRELHLFDGDRFFTHNAFRAPGAASIDQLNDYPMKLADPCGRQVRCPRHGEHGVPAPDRLSECLRSYP